jgi:TRAP-type C4-dicarboxylate transport system permease small subunit
MNQLFKVIQRIEGGLLAFAILAIAALTIVNVFARSLAGYSLASTEELCQFLIVLVTFVGLSYGASQGRHIRMTAIYDNLNDRSRKGLMILIAALTALLLFVLAGYATHYVIVMHRLGSVSPVLQVPLYLVYAIAPIGLALGGIQYVLTVIKNLQSDAIYLSYDVPDEYHDVETATPKENGGGPC